VQRITVLIADDHTLLRQALVNLLQKQSQVTVVGEAADGVDVLEKVKQLAPDVVLMDLKMPRLDGAAATRRIVQEAPGTSVVILTVSDTDEDMLAAVMAGAKGYLLKNATLDELLKAIEAAAVGEAVLSPPIAAKMLRQMRGTYGTTATARLAVPSAGLTSREQEILRLLVDGASNKQIAAALVVAESTVRGHVHHILDKLQLQNRLQAVAYAIREKLV